MRMSRVIVLGSAFASALAVAGPLNAEVPRYGGTYCIPILGDQSKIERTAQFGVHNVSASTATVECPFHVPGSSAKINSASVTIYNRSPTVSFTCTLFGLTQDGNILWQSTVSNSTPMAGSQQLNFFTSPSVTINQLNMQCTIPPIASGNFSHVASYIANSTP